MFYFDEEKQFMGNLEFFNSKEAAYMSFLPQQKAVLTNTYLFTFDPNASHF